MRASAALGGILVSGCFGLGPGSLESTADEPEFAELAPTFPDAKRAEESRPDPDAPGRVVPALVGGGFHACVLEASGTAACWGGNGFGQLGSGDTRDRSTAVRVPGLEHAVQLGLGLEHTCARLRSGHVQCWGANPFGQLGDGTNAQSEVPVEVVEIDDAVDLQLGEFEACVVRSDGDIACWGGNLGGMPIEFDSDTAWRARPRFERRTGGLDGLSVGVPRCLFGDRTVKCWGGETGPRCKGEPCLLADLTGIVGFAQNGTDGCAVVSDGELRCWGGNSYGQVPTGHNGCYYGSPDPGCPFAVPLADRAVAVAIGEWHRCALLEERGVQCWGTNQFGQIDPESAGDDPWRDVRSPTILEGFETADALAVGRGYTCARLRTGDVHCLGDMAEGRRKARLAAPHPY